MIFLARALYIGKKRRIHTTFVYVHVECRFHFVRDFSLDESFETVVVKILL